jgi:hypothetical protein
MCIGKYLICTYWHAELCIRSELVPPLLKLSCAVCKQLFLPIRKHILNLSKPSGFFTYH